MNTLLKPLAIAAVLIAMTTATLVPAQAGGGAHNRDGSKPFGDRRR